MISIKNTHMRVKFEHLMTSLKKMASFSAKIVLAYFVTININSRIFCVLKCCYFMYKLKVDVL